MGSGHILVYAFDVLYQIYLSVGYSERDIPRLILEKNIYGLDIDDRAGQLAYFALMMKARSYSRRIFRDMERNPISLNVYSIQESNGLTREDIEYFANGDENLKKDIEYLVEVFTDAKEYGSILEVKKVDFERIENRLKEIENDTYSLLNRESRERILDIVNSIVNQAKVMSKKYNLCITNPPYMGNKGMGNELNKYVKKYFKNSKSDLYSIFIEIALRYTNHKGLISMITMESWMFLSSFEKFRIDILINNSIVNLIHMPYEGKGKTSLGISFGTSAFIIRKDSSLKYNARYMNIRYTEIDENGKPYKFPNINNMYSVTSIDKFKSIDGEPIAYWISRQIQNIFSENSKLSDIAELKQGMATTDNERFLRYWYEINNNDIFFNCLSRDDARSNKLSWFPYNKGGEARKWYGNNYYIVNYENDGSILIDLVTSKYPKISDPEFVIKNRDFYFKEGITWSSLSSGSFSARYSRTGFIFDTKGSMCFTSDPKSINHILGYMNSIVTKQILKILCPTMDYNVGPISKLPINYIESSDINEIVDKCINYATQDWDSFETSWDFKKHPIIEFKSNNIENSFNNWSEFTEKQFNQLKSNEEELNRIFIDIYGLQDELTPEVEDKDITIRKADRERDIKSFISYAVGCMMGRYSLDEEGLAFAGGEFDINKYKIFKADEDAIIPITDAEYFEDDIVSKFVEFVKVVFGQDSLEENLNYIADTKCFKRKTNESSRDCLRRYFLKGFMEDHLKVYQKRPIYWMFDSGKQNGFKALIYMHRYNESMVAKIRTDYLHTLQKKYESEIDRLYNDMNSEVVSTKEKATAKKRKEALQKQLVECVAYDQVIAHVANQRIGIDLDDGVKINYQKFQGVEVPQGDGKKDLKADLLFKVKM